MDDVNRVTIEIGNKLMLEGEIFYIQDLTECYRVRLIRYLNEIYKVEMKYGAISGIYHWTKKGWFLWKKKTL